MPTKSHNVSPSSHSQTQPSITHNRFWQRPEICRDVIIIVVAGLALGGALLASARSGGVGFPLDDAWIHQTYARNLALSGQWAFVPDVPSAGSTAPLWTLLLAPGYLLGIEFHVWAYVLGWAGLSVLGLGVARLAGYLSDESHALFKYAGLIAGCAVALEWHMVWAAGSGMETVLFAALVVWLWVVFFNWRWAGDEQSRFGHDFGFGALAGALFLLRPEAVLAVVLAGSYVLAVMRWRSVRVGLATALGFAVLTAPYFALNLRLSGTLLPNTSSAKQAEYAVQRGVPYLLRFGRMWVAQGGPLVGAQILLLPGLLAEVVMALRKRVWKRLLPLGWAVCHVALYAFLLPVSYQHGRYLMPAVPLVVLYGVTGTLRLARPADERVVPRFLSMAWLASAAVTFLLFLVVLGWPAYVRDVRIIQSEMVATAHWLADNTPPDAFIAIHDIGAVGYFASRPLLDLAGLVSPDVIPIIRDEPALLALMEEREVGYLVTFPGWYPHIVADPRVCQIYTSGGGYAPGAGGENMAVYALNWQGEVCP